jgi:phenylalanyl-tRNA synthetase beta subunit
VAATIATHDLARINSPLAYTAKKPQEMKLTPLFKMKETTAQKLVGKLRQEAEELRKEKKRNTYSGIHKYLNLLDGQPLYPCLLDKDDVVISFPPITNCDITKVTKDTSNIFIEVTSSASLDTCKKVMDQLLQSLLEMGIGGAQASAPTEATATNEESTEAEDDIPTEEDFEGYVPLIQDQVLDLEQVKVVDFDSGGLKVLYPSRTDLASQYFRVIRE